MPHCKEEDPGTVSMMLFPMTSFWPSCAATTGRMETIIEVRPHGSFWKVFEKPGVELIFPDKEEAMLYATERARSRSGEIRVLDASGAVEKVISF
jgi:uncharacterized protein DUF2188